jgi:hypothetical protein
VEKRHGSTSLPPVRVSGHLLGTGGLIHDTSHGSEGEVWRVGPDRWGHHRHDHRLCMGGGWTTSGTTTRLSNEAVLAARAAICVAHFMKQPNAQEQLHALEKVDNYKRHTFIEQGGWDKMPGEAQAGSTVARACVEGLEVLMKK